MDMNDKRLLVAALVKTDVQNTFGMLYIKPVLNLYVVMHLSSQFR